MSIQGITPGLANGLRSLAESQLPRQPIGVHTARGHPIELWLTVVPAACVVGLGWLCLGLKVVNRLCHDAAQPETRAAWARNTARGQRPRARQRIAWWLWSTIDAGAWPDDAFSLGRWMTVSTLIGLTFGFIAYFVIG